MGNDSATYRESTALLSFSAENVRSYRDEVDLSLLGTKLSAPGAAHDLATAGTRTPVGVLPVAGIFGANASGKSTLLRAMADMRDFVLNSFRRADSGAKIHRHPFLLDGQTLRPSRFAIELILAGVRWQYGFEVDDVSVVGEYAYYYPNGRQALVFQRRRGRQEIRFGPPFRATGRALVPLVPETALLVSVAGAASDNLIGAPFRWFRSNLWLLESSNRMARMTRTADLIQHPSGRIGVLTLLQAADLGIWDIERFQPDLDVEDAERVRQAIRVLLDKHDDNPDVSEAERYFHGQLRMLHMGADGPIAIHPDHESQGTLAWLSMAGSVLESLLFGTVILVDQLNSSLHPHLVRRLVALFQDRPTNEFCGQLIFNSHDATILGDSGQRLLGRDQIWFTEKDEAGATTLYPLSDFHPKGDEAIGRRYLQGRYGGVPVLDPAGFRKAAESNGS